MTAEDDNEEVGEEEEEEDESVTSPSQYATPKKENLRKVSTGRVNKGGAGGVGKGGARSARGRAQQPDYVEENGDDDESNVSVYNDEDGQGYEKGGYAGGVYGGKTSGYGEEEEEEEEEDTFIDAEGGN